MKYKDLNLKAIERSLGSINNYKVIYLIIQYDKDWNPELKEILESNCLKYTFSEDWIVFYYLEKDLGLVLKGNKSSFFDEWIDFDLKDYPYNSSLKEINIIVYIPILNMTIEIDGFNKTVDYIDGNLLNITNELKTKKIFN